MKVIISHPTSNQFNRAAIKGLLEANMLSQFHTAVACFPGTALDYISRLGPFFSDIRRRCFDPRLASYTHTWPWLEAGRMIASKAGVKTLLQHESGMFSLDSVYNGHDKRVASVIDSVDKNRVNSVYAYEDGAAFSFRAAKEHDLHCLYDLPIGYWRAGHRLLSIEKDRWPDWIPTLTGLQDSEEKLLRKDEELRLADRIFVASSFTANTLKEFNGTLPPVEVIPYGFPPVVNKRVYIRPNARGRLKLLFVGGLSQRKGIADLFAVADALKSFVSLTVIGRKPGTKCAALDAALSKHHWIPSLPHHRILEVMRQHDVLIFPSLFEGFGLVITEAMSQGTPVITTDRTAGPDIIRHAENGWLVKAGSKERLHAAVEALLLHPEQMAQVGQAAMETARNRSWDVYGKELAEAIVNHQLVVK